MKGIRVRKERFAFPFGPTLSKEELAVAPCLAAVVAAAFVVVVVVVAATFSFAAAAAVIAAPEESFFLLSRELLPLLYGDDHFEEPTSSQKACPNWLPHCPSCKNTVDMT